MYYGNGENRQWCTWHLKSFHTIDNICEAQRNTLPVKEATEKRLFDIPSEFKRTSSELIGLKLGETVVRRLRFQEAEL